MRAGVAALLVFVWACGSSESSLEWGVVVGPPGADVGSFQCTADIWGVGPPQPCPADGCADRAALVTLCRDRFESEAETLAQDRLKAIAE